MATPCHADHSRNHLRSRQIFPESDRHPGKQQIFIYIALVEHFELATTQLLVCLPDAVVRRFKHNGSVRQRCKFIQRLLEDALEEGVRRVLEL
jgi:hypothetical protein